MEKALKRWLQLLLLVSILSANNNNNILVLRTLADGVTPEEAKHLRDEVTQLSKHSIVLTLPFNYHEI